MSALPVLPAERQHIVRMLHQHGSSESLSHLCKHCWRVLQAVVAGVAVVKNAALSRALRRKDQEMNQLIIMVRLPAMPISHASNDSAHSLTSSTSQVPAPH